MSETLKVPELPVERDKIVGFHQPVCSVDADGKKVEVTSGYGLGNLFVQVHIEGDRGWMVIDTRPLIEAAVAAFLDHRA